MAIQKEILTETGYNANYWVVSDFNLLLKEQKVYFTLKGFKDSTSKVELKSTNYEIPCDPTSNELKYYSMLEINYHNNSVKTIHTNMETTIDLDSEFNIDISGLINGCIYACYAYVKSLEDFVDSVDI